MKRNSSEPVCSPALGWRLSARGYAGRPTRGRPAKPEIDALHVGHDTSSSDGMGVPLYSEPDSVALIRDAHHRGLAKPGERLAFSSKASAVTAEQVMRAFRFNGLPFRPRHAPAVDEGRRR